MASDMAQFSVALNRNRGCHYAPIAPCTLFCREKFILFIRRPPSVKECLSSVVSRQALKTSFLRFCWKQFANLNSNIIYFRR